MDTENRATADVLGRSVIVLVFIVSVTGVIFFALFDLSARQFYNFTDSRGITGGAYSNLSNIKSASTQENLYITTLQSDIPNGRVGENFSFEFSASGRGPYTWGLEQPLGSGYPCTGRLPAGLKLSSDGVISGVPQAAETCLVGIRVSSPDAKPAKFDFAFRVS